jgi:hypothetical protein
VGNRGVYPLIDPPRKIFEQIPPWLSERSEVPPSWREKIEKRKKRAKRQKGAKEREE